MSDSDPALIGRTIANKYHVEQFLGGGAMGAVYKARQTALDKTVAVKVMHRAVAVDPSFVLRFRREARAASRIDHPNVMRVMDFDEEPDGLLYIAMEFLDGRDLYRVIHEDWPLSNQRIATVLTQTLSAIGAGHDMGVIHRDLKPENIMILKGRDAEGNETDSLVKVCDFGIAKITEKDEEPKPPPGAPGAQKLTTQGLVVGTPEYMSPEQARGEKLDARSDIYSIGVILYQLITGRTPFVGDTPLAVVLKHITEAPPPPREIYDGVHRGLEAVCLKALAKTPAERFQNAREMRDAIRAAIAQGAPPPVSLAAATAPTQAELSSDEVLAATSQPAMTSPGAAPITDPAISAPAVSAAAPSAPIGAATMTPLGTEAAPPTTKKKSAIGLVLGIAAIALIGGTAAGYTLLTRAKQGGDRSATNHTGPQSTTSVTAEPTSTAPSAPLMRATTTATAGAPLPVEKPRHGERHPKGENASRVEAPLPPVVAAAPPPAPTPDPPPAAPPPPPATTQAAPPAAAPPPAPTFDPGTCRAQVGNIASNGAVARKDLLFSAQPAWTQCARTGIKDKPSGGVAATVTMRFSGDNGSFRGATCSGCPGAVGACIKQSTSNANARLKNTSGDVTGDPEFTAAVTFTCD